MAIMELRPTLNSKKSKHNTETVIVVRVLRRIVIAISRPAVSGIIVPAATTQNTVRAILRQLP